MTLSSKTRSIGSNDFLVPVASGVGHLGALQLSGQHAALCRGGFSLQRRRVSPRLGGLGPQVLENKTVECSKQNRAHFH